MIDKNDHGKDRIGKDLLYCILGDRSTGGSAIPKIFQIVPAKRLLMCRQSWEYDENSTYFSPYNNLSSYLGIKPCSSNEYWMINVNDIKYDIVVATIVVVLCSCVRAN